MTFFYFCNLIFLFKEFLIGLHVKKTRNDENNILMRYFYLRKISLIPLENNKRNEEFHCNETLHGEKLPKVNIQFTPKTIKCFNLIYKKIEYQEPIAIELGKCHCLR